jgi:hypothetical protein
VGFPVAEAHPAEVVLAVEALHVVAAAVLLDADAALRALQFVHPQFLSLVIKQFCKLDLKNSNMRKARLPSPI